MFSVFKNGDDKSLLDYMLASIRTPIIVKCEIDLYIGLILLGH
jgi:hypothetical protein